MHRIPDINDIVNFGGEQGLQNQMDPIWVTKLLWSFRAISVFASGNIIVHLFWWSVARNNQVVFLGSCCL